jgi:hypothetical protein
MQDFMSDYAAEKIVEHKIAEARAEAARLRMAQEVVGPSAPRGAGRRVFAGLAVAAVMAFIVVHFQ